jgi:threonine synthase
MSAPRGIVNAREAVCYGCARSRPVDVRAFGCGCERHENLWLRYDLSERTRSALLRSVDRDEPSLWRYAPLLPVSPQFRSRLRIGWTPLCDCGAQNGVRLFVKDETRHPTGSLKDRASDVAVAVARAHGIGDLIVASTGNAAASLAAVGVASGARVRVVVPREAPEAKLAQMLAYGAHVFRVDGDYDDAYRVAAKAAAAGGLFNRSTGRNPFTREGKKTCAFEIAEQLDWQAPDWVIVPTGDGNVLSAVWKGFDELASLGLIDARPRLVAAQAAASDAITRAFEARCTEAPPAGHTLADSISVREPRDATAALLALRQSGGLALRVRDDTIVVAVHALASRFGIFVEPSSAAAYAAFERLLADGRFRPGDRVVLLATGSGLKDLRPVLGASAVRAVPLVARDDWRAVAESPA